MSGIYQIQSVSFPDRIYIGSAININNRWSAHLNTLLHNKHHSNKLQNHYNKYGKNDLIFSVIIQCSVDDLMHTEQYYLDKLNPYFNICKIAYSTRGCKLTEENVEKLRVRVIEQHKKYRERFGKPMTPSLGHRWKQSIETIKKKSESLKGNINGLGKKRSQEVKDKISVGRKGKHKGENHIKSKKVYQYNKNMELINNYISATEASKQTGIHLDSICRCAVGKYKSAGGFIWRYKNIV